jgi:hypothetical protein
VFRRSKNTVIVTLSETVLVVLPLLVGEFIVMSMGLGEKFALAKPANRPVAVENDSAKIITNAIAVLFM